MSTPFDQVEADPSFEPPFPLPPEPEDLEEEIDPIEVYWAARSAADLVPELYKHEERYFEAIQVQGFGEAWIGAFCAYYGLDPDDFTWATQRIEHDGDEGELLRFRVNEFRSFLRQMATMAIGQRPSFQATATNTDYDTLAQIESSDAAVNSIYWSKYGEKKERRTIEKGDLFGIGFTWVDFDPDGGEEIDVAIPLPDGSPSPAKQKAKTGDLLIRSLGPWERFCDPYTEESEDHLWAGARVKRSKWELAAQYPEHRSDILALSGGTDEYGPMMFGIDLDGASDDEVIVRHWYHTKSKALPEGRYVIYVGTVVLYDGPMPFRRLPFADYTPGEFIGTAFGYSEAWDLIPLGQMLDQVISDIATNAACFGRPTLFSEEGLDFDIQDLYDGHQVLTGRPGQNPPVPIEMQAIGESATWLAGYIEKKYQAITGLNAVARGQAAESVKSGTHAALMHSIAIEINSARQAAVDSHRERVANLILEILQDYLEHPWMLEIAGNDERPFLTSVSKKQFAGIRRVTVRTSNPMLRTQAGRLEVAKVLMDFPGAIQSPQQIIELLVSGQLKPLYQAPRSEMLRVSWENEQLSKGPQVEQKQDPEEPIQLGPDGAPVLDGMGQPIPNLIDVVPSVPVLPTDNPQKHILEHCVPLARAVESNNQPVVQAILAHIHEHLRAWKGSDPALAMVMGFPLPPGMEAPAPANDNAGPKAKGGELPQHDPREQDSTGVALPQPAEPATAVGG